MLSVEIPLIIVGGDEPTSQTWICNCDQNSASVEFCERHVCMILEALPLLFDPGTSELRGISSSFWLSWAPDDRELESPDIAAGGGLLFFIDPNGCLHVNLGFSCVASLFLREIES